MAGRAKSAPTWFYDFDPEAEVTALIQRIETATEFTLPDRKRKLVFEYAARRLQDNKARATYKPAKPP